MNTLDDIRENISESKITYYITAVNVFGVLICIILEINKEGGLKADDNFIMGTFLWLYICVRSTDPIVTKNILNILVSPVIFIFGFFIFVLYLTSTKIVSFTCLIISTVLMEIWIAIVFLLSIIAIVKNLIRDKKRNYKSFTNINDDDDIGSILDSDKTTKKNERENLKDEIN